MQEIDVQERIEKLEALVVAWQELCNSALYYSILQKDRSWNDQKDELDLRTANLCIPVEGYTLDEEAGS